MVTTDLERARVEEDLRVHALVDTIPRPEELLAGENRILEMVARGHSLFDTLEELCRLVESIDDGGRCVVFLAEADRSRIEHGVGPNMPASFLEAVVGRPVAVDVAPAAMACCLNEQVIAADLTTETRWASHWTPMALAHGVKACWATPFSSRAGKVLGAFLIYFDEPRTPTAPQQNLIEQFTHIATSPWSVPEMMPRSLEAKRAKPRFSIHRSTASSRSIKRAASPSSTPPRSVRLATGVRI